MSLNTLNENVKSMTDEAIVEIVQNYNTNGKTNEEDSNIIEKYETELIDRYDKLIQNIVYNFNIESSSHMITFDDLLDTARYAIIDAIKNYDSSIGSKFKTYCYKVIKSKVHDDVVYKNKIISLPENKIKLKNKINKTRYILSNKNGVTPTAEEIAYELNMDVDKVYEIEGYSDVLNYDNFIAEDEETTYGDMIVDNNMADPETNLVTYSVETTIDKGIDSLTEQEQIVIRERFGLNCDKKTLQEISDELGCSITKVTKLETSAIAKLKDYLYENEVISE